MAMLSGHDLLLFLLQWKLKPRPKHLQQHWQMLLLQLAETMITTTTMATVVDAAMATVTTTAMKVVAATAVEVAVMAVVVAVTMAVVVVVAAAMAAEAAVDAVEVA